MMKRVLALMMLMMMMLAAGAAAEGAAEPTVGDVGLDLMGCSVHYPQVRGLQDAQVQTAVNAAIMEAGQINARISRMAALMNSPVKLQVSYRHTLAGDVFSCAILSDGAVQTTRATQVWGTLNINLATGGMITFADLFTDEAAAREAIEAYLTEEVAPEQSAHLAAGNLTPLPETFSLSREGLTLH
ncbi:MAG: hypothetical protein IJ343_12790, partial [Clostridia bacterium]|nr:hypothetical protein [Clostridia bacterium]